MGLYLSITSRISKWIRQFTVYSLATTICRSRRRSARFEGDLSMTAYPQKYRQIDTARLALFLGLAVCGSVRASDDFASGSKIAEQSATDRYEAEDGQLGGGASVVGLPDGSDRLVGDLGGEASRRQAVTLIHTGDSVTITPQRDRPAANAMVIRYSIPDAAGGGGAIGTLNFSIVDPNGAARFIKTLTLTSRYSWLYGTVAGGTHLYNIPTDAERQLAACRTEVLVERKNG
jgi:hypothetical protein